MDIHIIIQGNPDGREDEERTLVKHRRKNMNKNSCRCQGIRGGVDLNRNFPHSLFGTHKFFYSKYDETYPGIGEKSEKEVKAIVDYAESVISSGSNVKDPETVAYTLDAEGVWIDIYSYGQDFFCPRIHLTKLILKFWQGN